MFSARHGEPRHGEPWRGEPQQSDWHRSTLKRRFEFHLGEAVRAGLEGSPDKAAGHSGRAVTISRELCAGAPDPARHAPELAAALCAHASYGASTWQAIAMLAESAGHYAVLAEANPAAYEVPRIDVLTQIAVASDTAGSTGAAVSLLREVIVLYVRAPAADTGERDFGLARARFHLGRCLLSRGMAADGLAETDAGLELASDVLGRLAGGLAPGGSGWLARAPRYLQLAAPDWAAAAVRAMTLHAQAGHLDRAAAAARSAVLVSGGLADLGDGSRRDAHAAITARAELILAKAKHPERTAAD